MSDRKTTKETTRVWGDISNVALEELPSFLRSQIKTECVDASIRVKVEVETDYNGCSCDSGYPVLNLVYERPETDQEKKKREEKAKNAAARAAARAAKEKREREEKKIRDEEKERKLFEKLAKKYLGNF